MLVGKCDRCGGLYEFDEGFTKTVELYGRNVISDFCGGRETYDLCPECVKEFAKWVNREDGAND